MQSKNSVFKKEETHTVSYDRLVDILQRYVFNDAAAAEPEYIREVLVDICGCRENELEELGLSGLFPEGYWD